MPGTWIQHTWQAHATSVGAPAKYRRACRYEAFVPAPLSQISFAIPAEVAGLVAEAEAAIGRLNRPGAQSLSPLARLLLRTESIASSKVEGMHMGVPELAQAEARADLGLRTSDTARELLDNIDAMEVAVGDAAAATAFGEREILSIHERLMAHAPGRQLAGRIRTEQNWIGGNDFNPCGADFVPPPPDQVAPLLTDLCGAVAEDVLSPLVQAALVHAQFETIHPFDDGNGRTGRALVHVCLRRRQLAPRFLPPISVVLAGARARYIDGLTAFRGHDVVPWIEHFAGAAFRATQLASAYVQAVGELQAGWRERVRGSSHVPRQGAAEWAIIDVLPAHPVLTGPAAVAATGLVKTAVNRGVERLVEVGVLTPLSASRRNRAWEAAGLLHLIALLEAGQLPG